MNFTADIQLQNDRVLLRALGTNDFANLKTFAINETELWKYSQVPIEGEGSLKKYIEQTLEARFQGKEYAFIVFDKLKNKYAGSTRFYDIQVAHATLQLGYTWYGKEFQGTGLNKHAKFLLLSYAFEELHMHRVEFRADLQNEKSIAAMKSIGCIVEGILRSHMQKSDGSRRDSIVLSILKHEWFEGVKASLQSKLF
ncbi:MAG: GNAT family N-acetyltransferase [Bacteroidetes bacterium]|nr:GNAT family N-acetyltransferase [Bacteroidota bacterium]